MAKVVILSGAGISAESGIQTFRDNNGLWQMYDVDRVCRLGCLEDNRDETIEFYDKRREELKDKDTNHAHKVIAELKKKYPNEISILTQNVDDLFEKAGLKPEEVVHLHGELTKVECEECGLAYYIGYKKISEAYNGKCPDCQSKKIRPFIVMFGEQAPEYQKLHDEIKDCELLVVIGTSGKVIWVDDIAMDVKKSILNNLEPSEDIDESAFDKVIYDKATVAIDEIKMDIINTVKTEVQQLSEELRNAIVHMLDYDLDGLTFTKELNGENLYNYLVKLLKEENLTKDEFNQVLTSLIVELKYKRDSRLGRWEKKEDYNRLLCFLIEEFEYEKIFAK
jgi:NAD-dependent deacetylase